MVDFIIFLCVALYLISLLNVGNMFDKRNVDPAGILPLIFLLVPIVNTLYWLIVGVDWDLKNNENLKRMFEKLPEKEKEDK